MSDGDYADLHQLEAALHEWLQEQAASGEYESFRGLVTHWSLAVDRVNAEDGEHWWSVMTAPDSTSTVSLGHAELIRLSSEWTLSDSRE